MSDYTKDLAKVKEQLLQYKKEYEEKLAQMVKAQFSDGQVQDPGDQASTSTMELLHGSIQDAEIDEYKRINRAIEKVNDGTYGICVDCGNDISEKRLASYPDAERCLVCQEMYEDLQGNFD